MVTPQTTSSEEIDGLAKTAIADGVFPCLEVFVAKGQDILYHKVFGQTDPSDPTSKLKKNSFFDLASLTKPLATAPAILQLQEQGLLSIDDRLTQHLPEFKQPGAKNITIKHLLTHTSGLPDWVPLFEPDFNKASGWQKLLSLPLQYQPGEKTVYSCLGYIILAEIIRRKTHSSLNDYCRQNIYQKLGLSQLLFNPLNEDLKTDIVPTGYCKLRKVELKGIVHDENAALFDGEGGNAGLFGTAEELHKLCTALLNGTSQPQQTILSAESLKLMRSNHNPLPLEPRGLGWDYKSGPAEYWSCSHQMPEGSIGHLGFTGTSLWMDPKSKLMILLLSNRVLLSREDNIPLIREFRPKLHGLILSLFLEH